ncbi:hypothetical protein GCM10022281_01870 [Sphingomonas rosea]|uniref:Outer membrane protein beta-barrel domain-containing protein n=1 Tax=Sphingomonas rosea TaxID=335605 RepID=A0ABP7TIL4_9SPHN
MSSRLILLAATALAVVPSAASARDGTPYVAIEGGAIKPEKAKLDYRLRALSVDNGVVLEHRTGVDADLLAGYDFGLIRVEGELGYKRAKLSDVSISPAVITTTGRPGISGRTQILSAMANALVDVGSDDGLQFYGGGGAGIAQFAVRSSIYGPGVPLGTGIYGKDRHFAWQLIGGIRMPVSRSVDVGLKYRYFRSKLDFTDTNNGLAAESLRGNFKSHSLLATLAFNFGAPAPVVVPEPVVVAPPPPPPPPPATQTCPDGSVILATDVCPAPPPPPPPPPPAPERG